MWGRWADELQNERGWSAPLWLIGGDSPVLAILVYAASLLQEHIKNHNKFKNASRYGLQRRICNCNNVP